MKRLLEQFNILKINNYYFERELTGGNMASSAIYTDGKRKAIVKFLLYPRNDFELKYFRQEVQSMQEIKEMYPETTIPELLTDLVKVEDTEIYYFMISYIEGVTLKECLADLDIKKSVEIVRNLVGILCDTSSSGIVHKDIHTGNIMVSFDHLNNVKEVYLLDFGVSENWIRNSLFGSEANGFRHIGAFSAWSPEFIYNPQIINAKHDIWGIGVLFFYLLTKEWPFNIESFGEYFDILKGDVVSNIDLNKIDNNYLKQVVKMCFMKYPSQRINCGNLYKMLNDYLCGVIDLIKDQNSIYSLYIEHHGDIWVCTRCMKVTSPNGNMCTACGNRDTEYLPLTYLCL